MTNGTNGDIEGLWLDLLPSESCERIAEHVCGGIQDSNGMHLALSSQKQQTCVERAIERPRIRFNSHPAGKERQWADLLRHRVFVHADEMDPQLESLLLSGCVTGADVNADNEHLLRTICNTQSIKSLFVRCSDKTNLESTFKLIQALRPTDVTLTENRDVWKIRWVTVAHLCSELAASLPSLKRINWFPKETFHEIGDKWKLFWEAVALLPPNVAHCLHEAPPERLMPRLATFQSIAVSGIHPAIARQLSDAVVSYNYQNYEGIITLDATALGELGHCKNIRSLGIGMLPEDQAAVPKLCSQLPHLERLELSWDLEILDDCPVDPNPEPGLILRIVKSAPRLISVVLQCGVVPLEEWKEVIKEIGPRIEEISFICSLDPTQMGVFLETTLLYLTIFAKRLDSLNLELGYGKVEEDIGDRILLLANQLQRKFPRLNIGSMEEITLVAYLQRPSGRWIT